MDTEHKCTSELIPLKSNFEGVERKLVTNRRISFPDDLTWTPHSVFNRNTVVMSFTQSSTNTAGMGGPRRQLRSCPSHPTGASQPYNWTALLNVSIARGLLIVT